ncbi:carboxypeptidase-like regulatory domain-containing protein [Labilibaculum sp. K2S]|uniref:M56 family metallopeptidase n=1 Tax=Labilibaculum sp. K2S TaxID=3056386 RepID=UPI0025A33348|nr:M56 family metallopeptidase [Labilibaculum sp. K2S]MDM8161773.1 carboxypeptidase-like regulatory domain-containing protein [Labilibaculum sp. K2S]
MEALIEILLRASMSMALLYSLYWLLLRQSTHFKANRYFLLASLLISVVMAIVPVHYQVMISTPSIPVLNDYNGAFKNNIANSAIEETAYNFSLLSLLYVLYFAGAAIVLLRIVIQCRKPLQIIAKSTPKKINNCLIYENEIYNTPFSFFNRILINPKYFKQDEINDILTHEKVHIHERHWIDLFIIELLTVFFWFNPFIWLFERAIKQNHEYLADEGVLTRGHSPVRYQALLINQLMGTQVIGLANHFSSAQGPTRFKMMTKEKTAKRKLFRMIWGIPILAILLVAFAEPEYKTTATDPVTENTSVIPINEETVKVHGSVRNEDGTALTGASVIIKGTTTGAVADKEGKFELNVPKSAKSEIIVSYVGYKTAVVTVNPQLKEKTFNLQLKKEVIGIKINTNTLSSDGDVPPPPPATEEFSKSDEPVFIVVEDMPQYNQGLYGLEKYVQKQKNKLFFEGKKLEGKATIGFTINEKGEVTNIQILTKSNDIAAKAATKIAGEMENWKPGSQRGKAVPVNFAMELEF